MITLYKRNAQGKPIFWSIESKDFYIKVCYGLVGTSGRVETINTKRNVDDEIKSLIKKLEELKLKHLYIIFDSNPYLLNMTNSDIDDFYQEKVNAGLSSEEIVDCFYHNIIL